MAPAAARTEALRRFGGVDKTKEEVREADRAVAVRDDPPGRPLRAARAAQEPGLRGGRRPDARSRHRREHRDLLGGPRSHPAVAAVRRRRPARPHPGRRPGRRHPGRRVRSSRDRRPPEPEPQFLLDRRVPLDVVRPPRTPRARARPDGRGLGALLRPHGREAHPGTDVREGGGPARGRGGPGPLAPVLDAQLRRRSQDRRPGLPHERPAAHRHRRAAADPGLSRRERRLHADLGVPVPLERTDGAQPRRRDAARLRRG